VLKVRSSTSKFGLCWYHYEAIMHCKPGGLGFGINPIRPKMCSFYAHTMHENSSPYSSPPYSSPPLHLATLQLVTITSRHRYISPRYISPPLHFATITFRHHYISPPLHFASTIPVQCKKTNCKKVFWNKTLFNVNQTTALASKRIFFI
jgi:hypothetical protein